MRLVALLERLGFSHLASDDGFAAGQPEFVFQLPLAGRSEEDVLAGMNQLWRRNIKKSAKQGVEVTRGGISDLPAFHAAYVETAARDHFTPRPLAYFERMFDVMTAEDPDRIRLYLAHHEGDLVQGSTAIQWQMMQDAMAAGAEVYDLRGITATVAADDSHAGLIRFKVGTGGEAVQYVGEWDLPLNRLLYKGFDLYMRRRG
jgi:lipid II:glycine glycyltransferase (peptidoglycan interpeptide bridge formation enzyme)